MIVSFRHLAFGIALVLSTEASAFGLMDCARTTYPSHGGEIHHVDLGEGRVMWTDWWSLEGTAKGITMVECASGDALQLRMAEDNMGRRAPFDRTDDVLEVIERHQSGARAFATFERIAADLENMARDIEMVTLTEETCACAAAYPALRGEKTEFALAG